MPRPAVNRRFRAGKHWNQLEKTPGTVCSFERSPLAVAFRRY